MGIINNFDIPYNKDNSLYGSIDDLIKYSNQSIDVYNVLAVRLNVRKSTNKDRNMNSLIKLSGVMKKLARYMAGLIVHRDKIMVAENRLNEIRKTYTKLVNVLDELDKIYEKQIKKNTINKVSPAELIKSIAEPDELSYLERMKNKNKKKLNEEEIEPQMSQHTDLDYNKFVGQLANLQSRFKSLRAYPKKFDVDTLKEDVRAYLKDIGAQVKQLEELKFNETDPDVYNEFINLHHDGEVILKELDRITPMKF